jgi:hypothetical protein
MIAAGKAKKAEWKIKKRQKVAEATTQSEAARREVLSMHVDRIAELKSTNAQQQQKQLNFNNWNPHYNNYWQFPQQPSFQPPQMGYQTQQQMGYQAQPPQMGYQAQQPNPYSFQAQPHPPHIGWQPEHNNQFAPHPMLPPPSLQLMFQAQQPQLPMAPVPMLPPPALQLMFQAQQPHLPMEYQAEAPQGQPTLHHVD